MKMVVANLLCICFTFSFFYSSFDAAVVDKTKVTQLEIPLTSHKSALHRLLEMGIAPHIITAMVSKKKPPRPKPAIENDTIPLFKHLDSEFYGEILLGHPGQKFNVVFDTAWGDSFVPSEQCHDPACLKKGKNRYDHSQSSTYVENGTDFEVDLSSGKISGYLSEDLLHLGHINVTNQTFAEIEHLPNFFLSTLSDGIFGMSFKALSKSYAAPFFYNIMQQYPNMPKLFSFYLNKDTTSSKGGSLILGAISKKHYNANTTINYFPVVDPEYWKIDMNKVYVEHPTKTFCERGCKAIFDTGASTISLPQTDIKGFNRRIGAYEVNGTNRYQVDCEKVLKLPRITFVFGNDIEFHLKGKEYIQDINIGPTRLCLTAFEADSGNDTWTLGGAFLYRYYSIFDMDKKRVGLVPALL